MKPVIIAVLGLLVFGIVTISITIPLVFHFQNKDKQQAFSSTSQIVLITGTIANRTSTTVILTTSTTISTTQTISMN